MEKVESLYYLCIPNIDHLRLCTVNKSSKYTCENGFDVSCLVFVQFVAFIYATPGMGRGLVDKASALSADGGLSTLTIRTLFRLYHDHATTHLSCRWLFCWRYICNRILITSNDRLLYTVSSDSTFTYENGFNISCLVCVTKSLFWNWCGWLLIIHMLADHPPSLHIPFENYELSFSVWVVCLIQIRSYSRHPLADTQQIVALNKNQTQTVPTYTIRRSGWGGC